MRTWWRVNKRLIVCNNRAGITTASLINVKWVARLWYMLVQPNFMLLHIVFIFRTELLIGRFAITVIVDIENGGLFSKIQ